MSVSFSLNVKDALTVLLLLCGHQSLAWRDSTGVVKQVLHLDAFNGGERLVFTAAGAGSVVLRNIIHYTMIHHDS